ncbi:trichohyalin-like isoform X2 [Pecten maximus]|uniref:trichohyalin-like isoform X2 n=1 Tax=Pecten maximus TaxID=6579 RepID=UPI0014587532|nr:trichohyalin-like isoform X2 [Pecten maximus]
MSYISTYPLTVSDICVPVKLEYESSELTVDEPWIFGAFFLGLLVGIVITALLVPCCLRGLAKKKILFLSCLWRKKSQDEEELLDEKAVHINKEGTDVIYAYNVRDKQSTKKLKFGKKKGRRAKRGEDDEEDEDDEIGADADVEKPPLDPALTHGIGDILVQNTIEGAEAEMSKQDVDKVDRVTRDLRREKDDMFLKQLKMQLRRMKVGDVSLSEIVNNVMEDLVSKAKMYQDEKQEVEDETRRQMSKDKNPAAVQTEVDKLDSQLEQKLVKLHEDERDFIRQELSKRTDLKDDEIEALMAALLKDMANLEKKLGNEFLRQNRMLEERLAKRRQILEFRKLQDQQTKEELKDNVEVMEEAVKDMVNNKDMSSKEATQLINQYMLDLTKLHNQHEKESDRQLADLADKLRTKRLKRMSQLQTKHERERAIQKEKLERGTETDFSQGYHDLLQKQRTETDVTETEIDQQELQAVDNLKQKLTMGEATQVNIRTQKIQQQLESYGQDSRKAEQIIDLHKARMDQLNDKRMDERNHMAAKLRERWEQRMQQLDEQEQQSFVEKETMNEQQNQTVNRVLSTSVELTDEAKKKIIREHQHNMEVLNNQLDKSKLRQQRNIEFRLNERRAKMAALRKQKEEAMANKSKASKEEMEKLEKQLEDEIALEQQNIEKERAAALLELRQRLATETEEALAQGEKELSILIGRMEVGSARRQLVLQNQDTMLLSLQEQLETKLAKGGVQLSGADQIIQQHNNQVDNLNQQLQASREDQEYNIREKIQAMKLQKERELQEKIVVEKQQKMGGSIRRRGASKASDVLGTLYMQQKHKREILQLEEDMKIELERSKEELNRQLQLELESELKNQKQQFITQLAATSGMSRDDIQDTVDSANKGGNKKQARRLAKELKDGMDRAKTDLAMDQYIDEHDTRPSSRLSRPSSGRPRSGSSDGGLRPKSGLKKKSKRSSVAPATESWGPTDSYKLYNDDDF